MGEWEVEGEFLVLSHYHHQSRTSRGIPLQLAITDHGTKWALHHFLVCDLLIELHAYVRLDTFQHGIGHLSTGGDVDVF